MNIYIYSQKIVKGGMLSLFFFADPIRAMAKIKHFLMFSDKNEIWCTDIIGKSHNNLEDNTAFNHFLILGKERDKFFVVIEKFCKDEKIFYFNAASKNELAGRESVFFQKNKKIKEYIDHLKEEYDIARANKDIHKMAECIKSAENIVSGETKVY